MKVLVENTDCKCHSGRQVTLFYKVIGYGRDLSVSVDFGSNELVTHYDYACDQGTSHETKISFCPFCGRRLNES